jgi:hypothetical protein
MLKMRSIRIWRWLALPATALLVMLVAMRFSWKQHVEIIFTRAGSLAQWQEFKLVDGESLEACQRSGLAGESDAEGRFDGERWQGSSILRFVTVEIVHDTLCMREGGTWSRVWAQPYAPAPLNLLLVCDLPDASPTPSGTVAPKTEPAGVICRPSAQKRGEASEP